MEQWLASVPKIMFGGVEITARTNEEYRIVSLLDSGTTNLVFDWFTFQAMVDSLNKTEF